jgi:hypothetical protein
MCIQGNSSRFTQARSSKTTLFPHRISTSLLDILNISISIWPSRGFLKTSSTTLPFFPQHLMGPRAGGEPRCKSSLAKVYWMEEVQDGIKNAECTRDGFAPKGCRGEAPLMGIPCIPFNITLALRSDSIFGIIFGM